MFPILAFFYFLAHSGLDYTAVSLNKTFVNGSRNGATVCVAVDVLEDEVSEGNETCTLELTTFDSYLRIRNNNVRIIIVDNNGKVYKL